eukprot:TRINITY_DN18724_c0_g1_i1.p1 TRINITY_DN18724_c0_g1~~TRINITY_DN18724_c0_g1_i1.p1  ORF type:complete len:353 (-),score=34.41 TRINITY_DN18724_c0_g1_i1:294-1352(-)
MSSSLRILTINMLMLWLSKWRGVSYRSRDTKARTRTHTGYKKSLASEDSWPRRHGKGKSTAKTCEQIAIDANSFKVSFKTHVGSVQSNGMTTVQVARLSWNLLSLKQLMEKASKDECEDVVGQNLNEMKQVLQEKRNELLASNEDMKKKCNAAHKYAQEKFAGIKDSQRDPLHVKSSFYNGIQAFVSCEIPYVETTYSTSNTSVVEDAKQEADSEAEELTEEVIELEQSRSGQIALIERAATLQHKMEGLLNEFDSTSAKLVDPVSVIFWIGCAILVFVALSCSVAWFWVMLVIAFCGMSQLVKGFIGSTYNGCEEGSPTFATCFWSHDHGSTRYAIQCLLLILSSLSLGAR